MFGGDGFDVSAICSDGAELQRIGHNRCGIGIDEYDFVTFFAEGFAGLGAGVVEFAGLADDDGSCSDDGNFLNVSAFGHGGYYIRFATEPQS